jgi:hypothetical protein
MSTDLEAENLRVFNTAGPIPGPVVVPYTRFEFVPGTEPFRCEYLAGVVFANDAAGAAGAVVDLQARAREVQALATLGSSRGGRALVVDLTGTVLPGGRETLFGFISEIQLRPGRSDKATVLDMANTPERLRNGLVFAYAASLLRCILESSITPALLSGSLSREQNTSERRDE